MNDLIENDQNQKHEDKPIIVKRSWAKTVSTVGVVIIIVFGIIYIFRTSCEIPGKVVDKIGQIIGSGTNEIKEIAQAFMKGTVVTEFRSYAIEVTSSNYLQVAKLNTNEQLSRTVSKTIFWDKIDLPEVKVDIMVPVEYTFYVDLEGIWKFTLQDLGSKADEIIEVIVHAPEIQLNRPSINLTRLTVNMKGSILRTDENEVEKQLMQEILPMCMRSGKDKIKIIRAIAKDEVEKFVQNWFVNFQFKDYKIKPHVKAVYFADEEYPGKIIDQSPEIKLKGKS